MVRQPVAACARCMQQASRRYYSAGDTVSNGQYPQPSDPGPSTPRRSWILDEVLPDMSTRPRTRSRRLDLEHYERMRSERTAEQVQERAQWWADPWYRLSKTPMRQCVITRQLMPCGFMVNFRPTHVELPEPEQTPGTATKRRLILAPDRLLHGRYALRKKGFGYWTALNKDIVGRLAEPGPHFGLISRIKGLKVDPEVIHLVEEQLCERVIQELELLRDRMKSSSPRAVVRNRKRSSQIAVDVVEVDNIKHLADTPELQVLQLLGGNEKEALQESGSFEREGAVAFLNLAGLDGGSKQIEAGQERISEETAPSTPALSSARPAVVGNSNIPGNKDESWGQVDEAREIEENTTSTEAEPERLARVPIYDLAQFFSPEYHSRLLALCRDVLRIQLVDNFRKQHTVVTPPNLTHSVVTSPGGRRAANTATPSTANVDISTRDVLVLSARPSSGASPTKLAEDAGVPLAMALWRLKLWHGEGWESLEIDAKGRRV